jgi:predicted DNA binding CopG/RHH family protein
MKEYLLNKEEENLLESIKQENWQSIDNLDNKIKQYQEVAKNTLRKDTRINIRLSSNDSEPLKTNVVEIGMPYQTLLSSILHQYDTGRLFRKSNIINHQNE